MGNVQKIDRTIVAIFDIERFSKGNPQEMVEAVNNFVDTLEAELNKKEHLDVDAFSTGDGVIVSMGRDVEEFTTTLVQDFFDFVISFIISAQRENLSLRTSLHYEEGDSIVNVEDKSFLDGKYIQVGDTINIASRIITYCEPREILASRGFIKLLRKMGLDKIHKFVKNEPFPIKHNEELTTYTYEPKNDETDMLYAPDSPMHEYKRYNYFPPLSCRTVEYFRQIGLEHELRDLVSRSYENIKGINSTGNMISYNDIVDVLSNLSFEPDGNFMVISRNDKMNNFWTQKRTATYIDYLKNQQRISQGDNKGYINQKRIMVYTSGGNEMTGKERELRDNLYEMHRPETFFSIFCGRLDRYKYISALLFGVTISEKHRYAIIAIPPGVTMKDINPVFPDMKSVLGRYTEYDAGDGPLKAFITTDCCYVNNLIKEFEEILRDPGVGKTIIK